MNYKKFLYFIVFLFFIALNTQAATKAIFPDAKNLHPAPLNVKPNISQNINFNIENNKNNSVDDENNQENAVEENKEINPQNEISFIKIIIIFFSTIILIIFIIKIIKKIMCK